MAGNQSDLIVRKDRDGLYRLTSGDRAMRCAVGKGGITRDKREGDGATPVGSHPMRRLWQRNDREPDVTTTLPRTIISPDQGWCDAPADPHYNRPVRLPFAAGHEKMWRDDHLYDLVIELGWNDAPPVAGRGSAIFLHLAKPDYGPTEGCVAVSRANMLALLAAITPSSCVIVEG